MEFTLQQPYVKKYGTRRPRPVFTLFQLRMAVFYREPITYKELNDPDFEAWKEHLRKYR